MSKKYNDTLTPGDKIAGNRDVTITIITDAVLEDEEGNVVNSYSAGVTYQGYLPKGTFTVKSGTLKLWGTR